MTVLGFSRETKPIELEGRDICVYNKRIYCKELVQVTTEAKKFQDLRKASCRPRRIDGQFQSQSKGLRTKTTNGGSSSPKARRFKIQEKLMFLSRSEGQGKKKTMFQHISQVGRFPLCQPFCSKQVFNELDKAQLHWASLVARQIKNPPAMREVK